MLSRIQKHLDMGINIDELDNCIYTVEELNPHILK
jgi:hypothetical protein